MAAGGSAEFGVSNTGTAPIDYQWRLDGSPLTDGGSVSGARTPTCTITGASCSDAGLYDCVVANSCGSVASATATLTVPGCDDSPCSIIPGRVDTGTGGAGPVNVLLVNGSAGDSCGRVVLAPTDPLSLDVVEPPSRAGRGARFWVGAWVGRATNSTVPTLPAGLGFIGMPMALTGGSPQPRFVANNIPHSDKELSSETWPGPPTHAAPYRLIDLPAGVQQPGIHVFFQGFVRDERSSASRPYSVTNGVQLEVTP